MALEEKRLSSISESDLQSLVETGARENKTVEFKLTLPEGNDDATKEFLADVSSFANATGGDILFGVQAKDGLAVDIPGVRIATPDAEILKLESRLRDGIAPRMRVESRAVPLANDSHVVVIRVPRSWSSPHMVTFKRWSRFFSRTSNGKYQLDVGEIRNAFVASESIGEKLRQFRLERLGRIVANETPVPLGDGPKIVVHAVPLTSFDPSFFVASPLPQIALDLIRPMAAGAWTPRYNFDGYVAATDSTSSASYVQLYRNGIIEAAMNRVIRDPSLVPGQALEDRLIQAVDNHRAALKALNVPMPISVLITILGVGGSRIFLRRGTTEYTIDRNDLLLPEVRLDDADVTTAASLRPAFDAFWSAAGIAQSPFYDKDGNRIPD